MSLSFGECSETSENQVPDVNRLPVEVNRKVQLS